MRPDPETVAKQIIELYQGGASLDKVRWKTGLTRHIIKQILKENNIPIRGRGPVAKADKSKTSEELDQVRVNAVERYESGESIDYIRSQTGFPHNTIKRWLQEAGIEMARRGRPRKLTDYKIRQIERMALDGHPVTQIGYELNLSAGSVYKTLRELDISPQDIRDERDYLG